MYAWIGRLTKGRRLALATRGALLLPAPVMFALVEAAGVAGFALARRTRRRILANMRELLPHTTRRARWRLCVRYFRQECLTIYEQAIEYRRGLCGRGTRGPGWRVTFDIDGLDHLDRALAAGRGVIVLTPHVGNYFYFFWWLSRRYECLTVATMGSPEIRPLYLGFEALGLRGFDYDNDSPLTIVRGLRGLLSRNGVAFLMGDFSRPGFPVGTLLGKPAGLAAGPVALALDTGAPIVPLAGRRVTWRRHEMRFGPPIDLAARYGPRDRDGALEETARSMDQTIREAPDQWLYWFNIDERWSAGAAPR